MSLAAIGLALPPGVHGSAALLPFGPGAAAAALRHGDEAWVVFDDRRPIDLTGLGDDPGFAAATVELLPAATLLRLKLSPLRIVTLARRPNGWAVTVQDGPSSAPVAMPMVRPPRLIFSAAAPGQVVAVPDADTGRNLLIGTLKAAGAGVPVTITVPEFAIRPSWQGFVVEPVSDRTSVRSIPEGFAVETGGTLSPALDNAALAIAATLTRHFDFPAEPAASLLRRLQAEMQEEGQAPPQARLAARKAAAQTMLALGLGPEAESMLQLAVTEDPRAARDPDIAGLTGIAALLSGRFAEAGGLDATGLGASDEINLWRGIRIALRDEASPEAAQALATTAGLVLAYPTALRNRLLPIVAETMVAGGAPRAVDTLLDSLPDEPLLAFARATRLEQKGDVASALTLYDALALGRDRLASARAATRATLLRVATKAVSPAEAVDLLERGFADWRGDSRERDLRLRTAAIAAEAGQWRKALGMLKETAQLFPDDSSRIQATITSLLGDMLHGSGSAIKPLDLVALAEENAGAIAKADASGVALLLADKLIALDLPQRAGPVIEQMALALPAGTDRAALGSRLAALRLGEGEVEGAGAALGETEASDLPPKLQEERGLIDARVHARAGDTAGALATLSRLGTLPANELRAAILNDNRDWHGAALALADVAAENLPDNGPLTPEQQDLVLRLASAQSRAGDDASLHSLGLKQISRMSGARSDMLRLLTSAPVTAVSDLRRVGGEVAMVRALPASLGAIGTR